jgi:hypothetical protein
MMDSGRKENDGEIWDMESVSVRVRHGVTHEIEAESASSHDRNGFCLVTQAYHKSFATKVHIVDEHVAMRGHDAGSARVWADGAGVGGTMFGIER